MVQSVPAISTRIRAEKGLNSRVFAAEQLSWQRKQPEQFSEVVVIRYFPMIHLVGGPKLDTDLSLESLDSLP